ncbi:MAG: hypothetical protein ABIN80_26275 [Dyadobacter sp.]|uniref:DUF6934 family protein n=1 Tax=Dyadobacter sp. TaxID=1914288 RepID=UPI003265D566
MLVEQYTTIEVNTDEYKNGEFFKKNNIFAACKFTSTGDSGSFELIVFIFRSKKSKYPNDYTLGFGKWNVDTSEVDDLFETRNRDVERILATVAQVAVNFLKRRPMAGIYAQGSTAARTRLYQKGISQNLGIVPPSLRIEGLVVKDNFGWADFKKGINYDAFLLPAK